MTNTEQKQNSTLKSTVLDRLLKDDIQPRSKLFWVCHECLVWTLWGISVFVGALAVAVMIFASLQASLALYEATHDSLLLFLVEVLPYIWLIVFGFMALFAYYNFRHTRAGYRYSMVRVLGSSLFFSVVGGIFLYSAGVGYALDTFLGNNTRMYTSQEEMELKLWQQPENGRMVGSISENSGIATASIAFRDIDGILWQIKTSDLRLPDMRILESGKQVRVLGIYSTTTDNTLYGCGVFPWMFDTSISLFEMQQDRRDFVERIYAQKDRYEERLAALDDEVYGEKAIGLCAGMPVIERIGNSMR